MQPHATGSSSRGAVHRAAAYPPAWRRGHVRRSCQRRGTIARSHALHAPCVAAVACSGARICPGRCSWYPQTATPKQHPSPTTATANNPLLMQQFPDTIPTLRSRSQAHKQGVGLAHIVVGKTVSGECWWSAMEGAREDPDSQVGEAARRGRGPTVAVAAIRKHRSWLLPAGQQRVSAYLPARTHACFNVWQLAAPSDECYALAPTFRCMPQPGALQYAGVHVTCPQGHAGVGQTTSVPVSARRATCRGGLGWNATDSTPRQGLSHATGLQAAQPA
jgi:hypothetical protein